MTRNVHLVDIQHEKGVFGQSHDALCSYATGPSIWLENTHSINISFYFSYVRFGELVDLDLGASIQILSIGICFVDW